MMKRQCWQCEVRVPLSGWRCARLAWRLLTHTSPGFSHTAWPIKTASEYLIIYLKALKIARVRLLTHLMVWRVQPSWCRKWGGIAKHIFPVTVNALCPESLAHSLCIRGGVTSGFWLTRLIWLHRHGLVSMVTWMLTGFMKVEGLQLVWLPHWLRKVYSAVLWLCCESLRNGLRMGGKLCQFL